METFEDMNKIQKIIETSILEKLTPKIMQVADTVQNSNASLQKTLIGEIRTVLAKVEAGMWKKWHLYALYIIIMMLIAVNFSLMRKEIGLETRKDEIVKELNINP